MLYEDLQQRYGNHIAKRVRLALGSKEFNNADVGTLLNYLETRAEKVAQDYRTLMSNPLERGNMRSETLQKQWRDAEDLAYLLSVAEDVSTAVRASIGAKAH